MFSFLSADSSGSSSHHTRSGLVFVFGACNIPVKTAHVAREKDKLAMVRSTKLSNARAADATLHHHHHHHFPCPSPPTTSTPRPTSPLCVVCGLWLVAAVLRSLVLRQCLRRRGGVGWAMSCTAYRPRKGFFERGVRARGGVLVVRAAGRHVREDSLPRQTASVPAGLTWCTALGQHHGHSVPTSCYQRRRAEVLSDWPHFAWPQIRREDVHWMWQSQEGYRCVSVVGRRCGATLTLRGGVSRPGGARAASRHCFSVSKESRKKGMGAREQTRDSCGWQACPR